MKIEEAIYLLAGYGANINPKNPVAEAVKMGIEALETQLSKDVPENNVGNIIKCKDCEFWTKQKDSIQGRCDLMQMYPTGECHCGNAQRKVKQDG